MEANKDSIIELGQVPPSREARARSMSYSKPTSAAAIAAALESSAGEGYESDMDSPHNKQRKSTHQMAMGVVILIQLLSICLTVVFYKKWYAITPYGSSALVSCLLCGFSQGLLQLIVYRRAQPVNLLKFYTWGVVNGIWTKWWTDNLSGIVSSTPLRILCDQLIGNPTNLLLFLTFVSYWDGRDIDQYFQHTYLKMLKTSYIIWPIASSIQFYFLDPKFLVPFNSFVNVFWTVILGILAG